MRGKKGKPHTDPTDPPRQRANKVRGHGTFEIDRPAVQGIVSRQTGLVRFKVVQDSSRESLQPAVVAYTPDGAVINTDEWRAYNNLSQMNRIHMTVCHTPGKRVWAKDVDGDGIREVHNNTIEGTWTGTRNFLRPFRGVNKIYLQQYLAIHECACNLKFVNIDFLRVLCGITQSHI
jgi:hypothetical protein